MTLISKLAGRLQLAIQAAGVGIESVSIGDAANKATWAVQPANLQSAAQPIIDGFNPNDPAHDSAELNLAVTGHLDQERIFSALVWAIIDTYSPPATVTKYNAAKTKIIASFKARPWKV